MRSSLGGRAVKIAVGVECQASERLVAVGTVAADTKLVKHGLGPRPVATLRWAQFKDGSFVASRAAGQRGAVEVSVRIADYTALRRCAIGAGWALRAEAVENGIRPGTAAVGSQLIDGAVIVRAADQRCAVKIALRVGDQRALRIGSVRAARKRAKAVDRRIGVLGMRSLWPKRNHHCGQTHDCRGDMPQWEKCLAVTPAPVCCRDGGAEHTTGNCRNSSLTKWHANSVVLEYESSKVALDLESATHICSVPGQPARSPDFAVMTRASFVP